MLSLLVNINPGRGVFTCISNGASEEPPLIGQIRHIQGERSARLTYITPKNAVTLPRVQDLLTSMTTYAASRGAFHLLAEAEENSEIFEHLRRFGFSVYAWQRIWQFTSQSKDQDCGKCRWETASAADEADIHWLYAALVPPLVQAANTPPGHPPRGLVYRKENNLVGFVEVINGIQGIFLEPLIHPDSEDVSDLIAELINRFPANLSKPVYVAVRSYQSWLEPFVSANAGPDSTRHALMIKHFTVAQDVAFEHSRLVQASKQNVPLVQHFTPRDGQAAQAPSKKLSGSGSGIL